jgi:hypothetical protein
MAGRTHNADRCREGLRAAARRRTAALAEHREATAELATWCVRARAAGLTVTEISRLAELSRERTYQLLDQGGHRQTPQRRAKR